MTMHEDGGETPVMVEALTRRFRHKTALDRVSLEIPRGVVFGLVGENGAGKTTLIKHIMGSLRAEVGSVRVFGLDPVREPEKTLVRIGYLSENRDLPNWMRVRELMLFTQAFYPDWDAAYAEELRESFGLAEYAYVRELSRGQRAQAGLLLALAHRPELLVLDEPSAGLDAVVRRDILGAVIRAAADEGRTVLFSSHLLDEVEYVVDYVGFLHEGRMVMAAPLSDIKQQHRIVTAAFPSHSGGAPVFDGMLSCEGNGPEWSFLYQGGAEAARQAVSAAGGRIVEEGEPSLEEIFVARIKGTRLKRAALTRQT